MRAQRGRLVHGGLEGRDDGLAAVEAEALGGVELVHHEGLEHVGEAEALEDVHFLLLVALEEVGVLHPFAL